ncbi:MAG TPA: undecaprenyl-diphosphate phosphatase [Bryobacteraceae bacterium]|nr:undecaprenyl-diphosphate phosphatase [Bryobacteraceae bacterium]
MPNILQIIALAVVQGLAELLPVSSSAHVIVAEKLMGLDPSAPATTLLLVMLHTGTMFAVIAYFWKRWRQIYFASAEAFKRIAILIVLATVATGVVGGILMKLIGRYYFHNAPHADVEQLFGHLELIAPALAAVGILILGAGLYERRRVPAEKTGISRGRAVLVGVVQGLALPFRGFSRSGATISVAMLAGISKEQAESFSFALAVVLTPAVIAREGLRLVQAKAVTGPTDPAAVLLPSLLGALAAFLAGLLALKWLSRWLESGRWYLFGIYCLIAAAFVAGLAR